MRIEKINDLASSEIISNVEKFRAIVHFKDGSKIESEWYYSDIHAKQFAMQYYDLENYSRYDIDMSTFKEDLSKIPSSPRHPVFG